MLQKNEQGPDDVRDGQNAARSRRGRAGTILGGLTKAVAQIALMAIVLGIALAATMRLVSTKPEIPKRPVFPTVYTVDTVIAEIGSFQPDIRLYGEVVAGRSVELRALVSGEIIAINDKLKSGDSVQKGEVLLEIDRFNYEGALREAQSNADETAARIDEAQASMALERSRLESGREQLKLAESDLERVQDLRSRGTATQKQVEDRELILSQRRQAVDQSEINIVAQEARIAQLQASVDRLNWKIDQSRRNLESTRLTAPFDGTIRSSTAEIGKLANVNDVLVSMYQAESLEARFVLSDEQFGRLQSDEGGIAGRKAQVIWNVGGIDYKFPASVDRIGAEIASARGGVEVFATIGKADHTVSLRPGAFVEIILPDRKYADHIRLPDSSLYHGDTVYVVENGELVEREVTVVAYDGDDVIVSAGLQSGEEVLQSRISEISAGLKVRKEGDPLPSRGASQGSAPEGQASSGGAN